MWIAAILLAITNLFFGVYVFQTLWNWFPADIFGIATVGYYEAFGLILVLHFFKATIRTHNGEEPDEERSVAIGIAELIGYIVLLSLGAVII